MPKISSTRGGGIANMDTINQHSTHYLHAGQTAIDLSKQEESACERALCQLTECF